MFFLFLTVSLDFYTDQLKGVKKFMVSTLQRRKSTRGASSGAWEDSARSFNDAMAWIVQQKVRAHTRAHTQVWAKYFYL